jgi:diphthamide synthase subunit DPH2
MKITGKDLEEAVKRVNSILDNIELIISYRYNYVAIDMKSRKRGMLIDTLISGLTKREAYNILKCIETVWTQEIIEG